MYKYIIAIGLIVLLCLYLVAWIAYRSYSNGLVNGINMMHKLHTDLDKEKNKDTGGTPWFHSIDVRAAADKIRGDEE